MDPRQFEAALQGLYNRASKKAVAKNPSVMPGSACKETEQNQKIMCACYRDYGPQNQCMVCTA